MRQGRVAEQQDRESMTTAGLRPWKPEGVEVSVIARRAGSTGHHTHTHIMSTSDLADECLSLYWHQLY